MCMPKNLNNLIEEEESEEEESEVEDINEVEAMIATHPSPINTEQLFTPYGNNEASPEEMENDNDDNITPQGITTILQTDLKLENYVKTLAEENAKIREENATILEDKLKVEEEMKKLRQDNLKLQNDFLKFREDMMKMLDVNARSGNKNFVNNN